jgi:hypothetical protein
LRGGIENRVQGISNQEGGSDRGTERTNEEFHNLYSSLNITRMNKSRIIRWVGHVARMGEMGNAYRILVRKPEWKRLLVIPRCS